MKDMHETGTGLSAEDGVYLRPSSAAARRFTRPLNSGSDDIIEGSPPARTHPAPALKLRSSSKWDALEMVEQGSAKHLSKTTPLVDFFRGSPASKAFDLLRTRLRQTAMKHAWKNIAICAPTSGCGNSFAAANLAMSLSRVPSSRTVLMDLNLRNPGQAQAFDVDAPGPIKPYLAGETALSDHLIRVNDRLALGLNNTTDKNAAELLQDPATHATLERMQASLRPDMVLFDLPPLLAYDDLTAFMPQLDGVLLVSDGTQTMAKHLASCERILKGQVPLLGVILNRARANSIEKFH
ncbi:CpsD/CapB family tyrosine-protein kinase [Sulfitobacter sp. SK012]|uniref:CpsD/CapB family tyrosine-protein kinase n=1 Tax=Sulfitobacter sp. SK012 TaxID=1389005 RepID=UPI0013B39862|nr:CpsD/CapB family tyrosine-protein kinase [Sulfitobacter sp. SK012]